MHSFNRKTVSITNASRGIGRSYAKVMPKKILLVGAGAVGQVFGKFLADAGNDISFLIKEKYVDEMAKGVVLYNLNRDSKRIAPQRFSSYKTLTSWQDAAAHTWDMIVLCIPTTALHSDGFDFAGLKLALKNSTLVILQPGPAGMELVKQHIAETQIVQGMITLWSYPTPLPGEQTALPGMAYWTPPLAPMPFAGQDERRSAVVQTFIRAKIKAKSVQDLSARSLYVMAVFKVFLTALEASGWTFDAMRQDAAMIERMLKANQEAFQSISAKHQVKLPVWSKWVAPWMVKSFLRVAPWIAPVDLEQLLQTHFTKLKPQTKLFVNTYIEHAQEKGISAQQLILLNSYT